MRANTLVETAYEKLRTKMIHGDIVPGMMLSENDLAIEFGMSRTPVRGAISRLEIEGLVQSLQKRGVLVKEISYKDSYELIEMMIAMQHYAVTIIEQAGFSELEQLREHYSSQLAATENNDYLDYIHHSMKFTYCFVAATRNNSMLKSLETIQARATLFAIINWRRTPYSPHFRSTPANALILQYLEQQDYTELKKVLLQSSELIRGFAGVYTI